MGAEPTGHGATRRTQLRRVPGGRRRRSKAGGFSTERVASEGRSGRPGYVTVLVASSTKDTMRRLRPWIAASLILLAAKSLTRSTSAQGSDDMVFIPAGTFSMGISGNYPEDEGPQHDVNLSAFWIDRYEATNAEYRQCVTADVCPEPADLRYYGDRGFANHPVVFVTWYNARDYCEWRQKRLPTEAEWERAARGGDGRSYPWGNQLLRDRLNADNRVGGTSPVGSYPSGASPYGALDMAGNVWEWVADWYEPYPGSTLRSDLFGQKYKVVRGGSWNHPAEDALTFHRDIAHPARAIGVVGFRCTVSVR